MPRTLLVAASLAVLQALGLVVYAVAVVVAAVRGDRSSASDAALLVVLVLGWAAVLVVVARGLYERRRWARAPLLLSELLLVAIGVPLAQGESGRWVGVVLVASAAVGAVAVLSPSVTRALEPDAR